MGAVRTEVFVGQRVTTGSRGSEANASFDVGVGPAGMRAGVKIASRGFSWVDVARSPNRTIGYIQF